MYVTNRVTNRYTHSMEGREAIIDRKERHLCVGEEERDVRMEAGVYEWQVGNSDDSLTVYQTGNLCLGGHE